LRANKPPVDHHYVPKHIIRNFSQPSGQVFWRSKVKPQIRLVWPEDIFFKKFGNSFIDRSGNRNSDLELRLSTIDYEFSKIQHQINDAINQKTKFDISLQQRNIISIYIYVLWKRNPTIRNWFHDKFHGEFQSEEFSKEIAEKLNDAQFSEFQAFFNQQWIASTLGTVIVEDTLRVSQRITEALNLKKISCVTPKNNKSFILGSNPLVWLRGIFSEGIGDPESELWMPISPKVCLLFHKPSLDTNLKYLENDQVRFLNLLQWKQSDSAVACSSELLRSIATSR
jgi:hypothetical protein